MIDPGHPFSVPYAELIAALEDRIRNGVEQPDQARFVFKSAVSTYELPRPGYAITQVTGMKDHKPMTFLPDEHYRFANNRIVWTNADQRPDEGSRLFVDYTYLERPAGLTDFNPGSVTGTLIRAVAREVKVLYEQMDEAYRRAFIDVATGVALDNVVAVLGMARNPAIKATGAVTFLRKTAANNAVVIPVNTRIADEGGREFVTTQEATIPPQTDEFGTQSNGVVNVANKIAQLIGIWPRTADPASTTPLTTKDTQPKKPFGDDERTITLADGVRPTDELRIRYKPKSVTVAAEAAQAGPNGNVNAQAIVVMPTPPTGVTGVVNEAPTQGGRNPEPDDQLRERAKHALERAGNATLNAIKYAVLDVDGVDSVEVIDHSVDEAVPLGEVRVRYAAGNVDKVREDVRQAIERTRAAGIVARLEVITQVVISGTFYVIPDLSVPATALATFRSAIVNAIQALTIGDPLSVRRLNALAYQVPGLSDVAEAQLTYRKPDPDHPGSDLVGDVSDPFTIANTELLRPDPDTGKLKVVLLTLFKADRPAGSKTQINLQLLDATNAAVTFKNFAIDLSITIRATLINTPDQPPERVGNFTHRVALVNSNTVALIIDKSNAPDFRAADHDPIVEVNISAAAYPGIQAAITTVDFS
jgi:uncharacterized phage protein gp47/JayE